jgi:hypothetical protein
MRLADFFTEPDDAIAGEINVDPLGTLIIWSVYGQQVFRNRISSISNDARSYTVNLFHHNLIRKLVEDDEVKLSAALAKRYQTKDSLAFKQASLLYLENLFVFAMIENESARWVADADSTGVLGILKGRQKLRERQRDAEQSPVTIGFGPDQEILTRQLLLGVSGRYKTPMVEMGFFDKTYRYDLAPSRKLWEAADAFIERDERLAKLGKTVFEHLKALLAEGPRVPMTEYGKDCGPLKRAYVSAFPSSADVGKRARDFWLGATGLSQGVPGAMLKAVAKMKKAEIGRLGAQRLFELAKPGVRAEHDAAGLRQIDHIERVEPFLADLELLFSLMNAKGVRNVADVKALWKTCRRDATTIPARAAKLEGDEALHNVLSSTGRQRLGKLLAVGRRTGLDAQMTALADYHRQVMDERGQSPWLAIEADGGIRAFAGRGSAPAPESCPAGYWLHHYYIPQFLKLAGEFDGGRA